MRRSSVVPLLFIAAACGPTATVSSPSPDASTSYVVRRGTDTIALERYTRAGKRGRRQRFISFISFISIAGIGLGVAALIVVLSVMNGFQKEVAGRMLGILAHIEVFEASGAMPGWRGAASAPIAAEKLLPYFCRACRNSSSVRSCISFIGVSPASMTT